MVRVCVAGASGWVGRSLVPAILGASDLQLVGAVSRSFEGRDLGEFLHGPPLNLRVSATVEEALRAGTDVLVDFTSPDAVKSNVFAAVERKVHAVVGTSGLSDTDYQEIDALAKERGVGVLAAGNFSIAAVLLEHFALIAAKHMPAWEVIDYADAAKVDAPSGTVREFVYRLSKVRAPEIRVPIAETQGVRETRGAGMNGTQVHSVRLPGYVIGAEIVFAKSGDRLAIRYDAGTLAEPYIEGTLLAVRNVRSFTGLRRGLDQVMQL
jgi:4-hydroxy-tetrahydrodipicolinate reductase